MGRTLLERQAESAAQLVARAVGTEVARQRSDAGISQRRLASAAGINQSLLARIEAGQARPSIATMARLAAALDADVIVRLYPNTGPPIRDRHQARMVEALLRLLHPSWRATLEVPVRNPARGVIDVVLHSAARNVVVAVEVQSELRRVEQQLRWAAEKAESLPSSELWRRVTHTEPPTISRLLLLRSTRTTRALVGDLQATFAAAYPADAGATRDALTTEAGPWPGDALLWATVEAGAATVLEPRPLARRPVR